MRKIFSWLLIFMAAGQSSYAQVSVTATSGTPNATYLNLRDAFTMINLGTHKGSITINITGNTTELAVAALNANGDGNASYTSINIRPSGNAARTISGALDTSLVFLNGADNVTIDGLNTAGNSLTITNTSTSNNASTILFAADATNNTINRVSLLGSTGALGVPGFGVVYFSAGTVTGNNNNTISNCNIGPAGTNYPTNCIYSVGVSTSILNSANTILNNNIYDFFTPDFATTGILLPLYDSGWTISGNSIYQTTSKTYTNANTHMGISITSGSGYTISNNTIGGSSANGAGSPYSMLGSAATRFIGINIGVNGTTVANSIQGNLVTNISLSTSSTATTANGILCGISIVGGNANVDGNTIGTSAGINNMVATSNTTASMIAGINASSNGTVVIQNNTIGGLSNSNTAAGFGGNIIGINVSAVAASMTINGNTIGNATADNMRGGVNGLTTASTAVTGVLLSSTPTIATVNNNTIQNLSSFGTNTGGFVRGIQTATASTATATGWSISNNTVRNLNTNSSQVGMSSGLCSALGIHHLASQGCVIADNSISNISNNNAAATTNIIVAGITSANATVTTTLGTTITRNKIWGLRNASIGTTALTPPIVTGIAIRSGNSVIAISNNMISLGNGQTTNTSFIGIWCQNGSTPNPTACNIYFNTVNIEGTVAAGALPSFGFMRSSYLTSSSNTVPVDVRNNIFQNNRTGGTGQHFAISNGYNSTTVSAAGWAANASNYNLLNANAATIGHWTTALGFAAWQTAAASDANSVSNIAVTFVNTALGDLHLNMGVTPTVIESGGTVIPGLTNDYDNQQRPGPSGSVNGGGLAPDLGADEFDGVYLDILSPLITYTPLSFTCASVNRTLVATITDVSGVPTSGSGLPVLYWRINAGAYTPVTATSLGGNNYQFVFGAGASLGSTVSYYIVARDNATTPNITAYPLTGAAGFTANPPAVSTPPTTPSSYQISNILPAGIYKVGTNPLATYPTLTAALNDYNTRCLGGPIVFELTDVNYAEAGAMTIIKHPDASAINTLTIRPVAGGVANVSATVPNAPLLKILGSYVTINGSNNGTNNRYLTFSNLSTTGSTVILLGSTGTDPITNVAIRNTILINGVNTSSALVVSDGATSGTEGYFNNISIVNNDVQNGFFGIYCSAANTAGNGTGIKIDSNQLNTAGIKAIRRVGIYTQGISGGTVSDNIIGNFETTTAENDYGIWLATNSANLVVAKNTISNLAFTATGNNSPTGIYISSALANANISVINNNISTITSISGGTGISTYGIYLGFATGNVSILKNQIRDIKNTSSSGWGAKGILLGSTSTAANCVVANNFISDVAGYGYAGTAADDNGNGIAVSAGAGYNIYNNTVHLNSNQTLVTGLPAALLVTNGVTTPGAINLSNNIFANSQTVGTERYAILCAASSNVFASIDYNDYYSAGPNIGLIGGTGRPDLAAIQAGFGGNTHSLNLQPVFESATDLHLNITDNNNLDNRGSFIATVTTDIDEETRSSSTPDMGADEFKFLGFCAGATAKFVSNISGATYQWQMDSGSGFVNITDNTTFAGTTTNTLTITNPLTLFSKFKFRCVVDVNNFSEVQTYKVGAVWTGNTNNDWSVAGNWNCGSVPDQYTNVLLRKGAPNYPLVGLNVMISSLTATQATLITLLSGFNMTLTNY